MPFGYLKQADGPERHPELGWPLQGVKPSKDSVKKEAEKSQGLLCAHHQKCHGDRGLCAFVQPSHNQFKKIFPLP
jgi:hypothetical protein